MKTNIASRTFEGKNIKGLQRMAAKLLEAGKDFVILADQEECKVVVSHNLEGFHCGNLFRENVAEFGGKGGGSAQTAQASFQKREDMERFTGFLQEHYQSIV